MLCNQLSEDNYLVRCSETGYYHELTDRQLWKLVPVEVPKKIYVDIPEEVMTYLSDKEQVRIANLIKGYED
jgi:hypothetical protein